MYTLANPAGVIKFHMVLDARLAAMHRIHPIFFFLKPGSDLYDDQPSNVNEEYSDWHKQSVNRIEAEIAPVLTQYFLDETISKEEKAHTVWPAEGLFEFVPKNISPGYAQKLIALAEACTGYHSYIDGRLKQVLVMLKDSPA
ncbi:MAG TPA: hypothetical protein VLZ81_14135 [Blastocatellia bacterium]|nr:hypothetical protein [Blastocatellia bacterium]